MLPGSIQHLKYRFGTGYHMGISTSERSLNRVMCTLASAAHSLLMILLVRSLRAEPVQERCAGGAPRWPPEIPVRSLRDSHVADLSASQNPAAVTVACFHLRLDREGAAQ